MLQLTSRRLPFGAFALALPLFMADMAPPFGCGGCGGNSDRPPHPTEETVTTDATNAADTALDVDDNATAPDTDGTAGDSEVTR